MCFCGVLDHDPMHVVSEEANEYHHDDHSSVQIDDHSIDHYDDRNLDHYDDRSNDRYDQENEGNFNREGKLISYMSLFIFASRYKGSGAASMLSNLFIFCRDF